MNLYGEFLDLRYAIYQENKKRLELEGKTIEGIRVPEVYGKYR